MVTSLKLLNWWSANLSSFFILLFLIIVAMSAVIEPACLEEIKEKVERKWRDVQNEFMQKHHNPTFSREEQEKAFDQQEIVRLEREYIRRRIAENNVEIEILNWQQDHK